MARTTLTPITVPSGWATTVPTITWTAADTTNNNQFKATGAELLLIRNTSTSNARTVTVLSVPDAPYGRTGHLVITLQPGDYVVTQVFPLLGWQQQDGHIYVNGDSDIEFAVIRIRR